MRKVIRGREEHQETRKRIRTIDSTKGTITNRGEDGETNETIVLKGTIETLNIGTNININNNSEDTQHFCLSKSKKRNYLFKRKEKI